MSDIVSVESTDLSPVPQLTITPISEMRAMEKYRKSLFKEMVEGKPGSGAHYGVVPGIKGNVVYKEGIEFIESAFNITGGDPIINEKEIPLQLEDGTTALHVSYTVKIPILEMRSGAIIGVGVGTCSTLEPKYRYRGESRKCPSCGAAAIIKGKADFGGGWLCFKKKDGCGKKFENNDPAITEQLFGKMENADPADVYDTVLSMAEKRAEGRVVLKKTQMKRWFRLPEDIEDGGRNYGGYEPAPPPQQKKRDYPDWDENSTQKEDELDAFYVEMRETLDDDDLINAFLHDTAAGWPRPNHNIKNINDISSKRMLGSMIGSFRKKYGKKDA